jgi:hypothetical protein
MEIVERAPKGRKHGEPDRPTVVSKLVAQQTVLPLMGHEITRAASDGPNEEPLSALLRAFLVLR